MSEDKKGNLISLVGGKSESEDTEGELELNENLIKALEEVSEQAKKGEVLEAIILPRYTCGRYHPIIQSYGGFNTETYYMLDKMKYVYEDALIPELEE